MPNQVTTLGQSGTLRRGLRDAFNNAYDSQAELTKEALEPVMALGLPSDTDKEFYAYYEHAPYPKYWPRGSEVEKAGFKAVQFNIVNHDYGLEVEWHGDDESDDQTGVLRPRAAQTGTNFAYNPTLAFFDLLLSTTSFLPSTTNAPDGAAVFSTTDGDSNDRFGATNGNLLTGTGVASSAAITTDVFNAMEQFRLFQNTEGEPLFPDAVLDGGFIVYAAAGNERLFTDAFNQNPTSNIAPAAGAVAVQNTFVAAGKRVELRFTQKITDNDHYLFLRNAPDKPFFQQMRKPVEEQVFDEGNSKESARSLLRSMIWHERTGYGIFLPYGVVKTNNA
jgi:hypothetical protein